jgi:hypothetical protein
MTTPRQRIIDFIGIIGDGEMICAEPETAGAVAEIVRSLGRDIGVRVHPWTPAGNILALNRFAHVNAFTGGPAKDWP